MAYTPGSGATITLNVDGARASTRDIDTVGEALRRLDGASLQGVVEQATQADGKIASLRSTIMNVIAVAAAGITIGAFAALISDTVNATAALNDMSIQTGASVASLMQLRSVAATGETSLDNITNAMNALAKGMSVADEDSKGIGRTLKALGLDFTELANKSPEEKLIAIAKALDGFEDGSTKSAAAMTLFKGEGAKMLPFLKDLADQSDAVTAKLTAQEIATRKAQAAMADDYGDNLARVGQVVEKLKNEFVTALLPALAGVSSELLALAERASQAISDLVDDGTIAAWADGAVTGLKMIGAAIGPAIKIATAYFAIFVAAPVIIAATSTVLTYLVGVIATYSMNVVIGQTATIAWNTSLFGTSVAAELAAGSLSKLRLAGLILFAAFAGWQIGTYLSEEFMEVRLAGAALVGGLLKGWEHVKYGAEMAWEGIKFAWDKTVSALKLGFAQYLSGVAAGFALIGATETSKEINAYAESLRAAAADQKSFAERTAGIAAAHTKAVDAIDENILSTFQYELGVGAAAKAETAAAKPKEKLRVLTDEQRRSQEKATQEYAATLKTANDYIESLKIETALVGLNASQIRMMTAARAAAKAPTVELRKEIMQEALALDIATSAWNDKVAAEAAVKEAGSTSDREIRAIEDETAALVQKIKTYGMLPEAITRARVATLAASREAIVLSDEGRAAIEREIEALNAKAAAQSSSTAFDAQIALTKVATDAHNSMWSSIDKTAHETFVSIFDSGKNAFDRLKDTLKNGLLDMLYQMTIKKWIFNISASVGVGVPGAAQAGTGTDPITGTIDTAQKAYAAINNGFASLSTSVAKGVQSGMSFLGASSGNAAAGGQLAGKIGGYAAGAAVGVYGGRAISGGYGMFSGSGNTAVNAGTIIGALVGGPIGAAIGGMIGGVANRLFGMKAKEMGATTLNGSFGAGGFAGTSDTAWSQKGGLFRSDKSGVDKTGLDAEMAKTFTAGYDVLKIASADFAKVLGINADSIATRTQSLSIALTKDAAENEKAIAAFFVGVGDAMALELVPSLASLTKEGESAGAALQRIATNYAAVDQVLAALSMTFNTVGLDSIAARERLVGLTGGIEQFGQSAAFFAQNFMTEAERLVPVAKEVEAALAAIGMSGITTRDEFKNVVVGLDLTTEKGATTYAALMNVQQAFAMLHPVADAAAAAVTQAVTQASSVMSLLGLDRAGGSAVSSQGESDWDAQTRMFYAVVAQQQAEAAAKLKTAWMGLTDSIFDEVQRIRGVVTGTGAEGFAEAQARFAMATAQARTGDQDAAGMLPKLSQAMLQLAEVNAVTAVDLQRIQSRTAGSLEETGYIASASAGIVRTPSSSSNAALLEELRAQRAENASMKTMIEQHLYAIAKNTMNSADVLEKQETIGLPATRPA